MASNTILDLDIIATHSPKTLGVVDISIYKTNQVINSPTLEITPPAFGKVSMIFTARDVNIFNSNNLKLSDSINADGLIDLPDGIWKFKYSISPATDNFIRKKYFRTDLIQNKYYQAFLEADFSECTDESSYCLPSNSKKDKENKLREIELMINGCIAAANRNEDELAMSMYKRADGLLNRINICKTC